MNARSADFVAYTLLANAVLAGLLLWGHLPEQMAIHFGAGGEPDTVVAKPVGILVAPLVGLGGLLATRYTPERLRSGTTAPEVENIAVMFLAAIAVYTQGFLYAWNLGYRLDTAVVTAPALIAALAIVAYSYRRGSARD
jgi:uncharacterized membrane protein